MSIALTVSGGRVSPCFAGTELWICPAEADAAEVVVLDTTGWRAAAWGVELMRSNVSTLLCAGIDRFVWGSLQGHGIEVVPQAVGEPSDVLARWHAGRLSVPREWPPRPACCGRRRGRSRGRFRGGC